MASVELQGFRRQLLATLHEYEGYLKQVEGKLLVLRSRAERATGETAAQVASALGELEREAEVIRGAGLQAMERLGRAVEVAKAGLARARVQVVEDAPTPVRLLNKGKEAVGKAAIEAKALRHGIKVGLRVARRVSKRVRTKEA